MFAGGFILATALTISCALLNGSQESAKHQKALDHLQTQLVNCESKPKVKKPKKLEEWTIERGFTHFPEYLKEELKSE